MSSENEEKDEELFPNFDPTQNLSQAANNKTRKRGLGAKPLMESEIKDAQAKARSASEAARIIGVSYNTYKKYAKKYGIFEDLKNPSGVGISKGFISQQQKYKLDDIIAGKHPKYPNWKLKRRLIDNGYMENKCNNCGFDEKRITDDRVPLVLDHLDGDKTNHEYDNLRMLCFNCSFLLCGNLTGPRKDYQWD